MGDTLRAGERSCWILTLATKTTVLEVTECGWGRMFAERFGPERGIMSSVFLACPALGAALDAPVHRY